MLHVTFQKSIFLVIQVALFDFVLQTKADGIRSCSNFTCCIDSYADIYKSLTLEDNSFNIVSALYPAMKPSSLVVKVQIFGPNLTSLANYTWSINCLYVAFPAEVLQVLSFGSILVTPRTQHLNVCIPYFCRNFSSLKDQKDLMKGVLAAVSVNHGLFRHERNECSLVYFNLYIFNLNRSWTGAPAVLNQPFSTEFHSWQSETHYFVGLLCDPVSVYTLQLWVICPVSPHN